MAVREYKPRHFEIYGRYTAVDGTSKRYKKRLGKINKREAIQYDLEYKKSLSLNDISITFDELVSLYHQRADTFGIKESTLVGDLGYYNNHLKDSFGNMKVTAITPNHIELWKIEISKKVKPNGEKYSVATLNHAKNVLSKYLSYAERMNMIQYNPSHKVPAFSTVNVVKDDSIEFWEIDEFNKFMEYVDDKYWIDVFTFLFQTGVRQGEMFALTWNDINFKRQKININKTLTYKTLSSGYAITPPKTKNSIRKIDMTKDVYALLEARLKRSKTQDGFNGKYYVFGDINPLTRRKLADTLDKYIMISGVNRITPHGFRHSHASILINADVPDELIAERLGHTVNELHKTYVHIYKEKRNQMKEKLNVVFG